MPTNEIEVNTVAYVKITFEPVFVLEIFNDPDGAYALPAGSRVARCRRGVVAQNGSFYDYIFFTLPELTPIDPNRDKFEKLFKTEDGEISFAAPASPDDSLLQN